MTIVTKEQGSNIIQMGDRKLPSKLVMIPLDKEGHKTIMQMSDMEFNTDITENFFSQQNMKKVR